MQVGKEDEAKQDEEDFAAENIDQILAGRTEKRQIGNRKGNTFSTATFSSNEVIPLPSIACQYALDDKPLPQSWIPQNHCIGLHNGQTSSFMTPVGLWLDLSGTPVGPYGAYTQVTYLAEQQNTPDYHAQSCKGFGCRPSTETLKP